MILSAARSAGRLPNALPVLIESTGDTTQTQSSRQSGLRELAASSRRCANATTYLACNGGFHQSFGYAGTNPPTYATVARQDNGVWSVTYILRDGKAVQRSSQFDMTDCSDAYHTEWIGTRGAKQMHGQVLRQNGDLIYSEELVDRSGSLLSSNWIDCGPASPPTYAPPVVAVKEAWTAFP